MRFSIVVVALSAGCLSLGACATTQSQQAAAAPSKPQQTAESSGDHLICRSVDVTGSRMPSRECHTSAEWARLRTEGNDQLGIEAQRSLPSKGGN